MTYPSFIHIVEPTLTTFQYLIIVIALWLVLMGLWAWLLIGNGKTLKTNEKLRRELCQLSEKLQTAQEQGTSSYKSLEATSLHVSDQSKSVSQDKSAS